MEDVSTSDVNCGFISLTSGLLAALKTLSGEAESVAAAEVTETAGDPVTVNEDELVAEAIVASVARTGSDVSLKVEATVAFVSVASPITLLVEKVGKG